MGNTSGREIDQKNMHLHSRHKHSRHKHKGHIHKYNGCKHYTHKRQHNAFKTRRHRHYGGVGSSSPLNPSGSKTVKSTRKRNVEKGLLTGVLVREGIKAEKEREEMEERERKLALKMEQDKKMKAALRKSREEMKRAQEETPSWERYEK
jgi:hypothetical protein